MRTTEFYANVLALFRRANGRLWEPYEETLFTMRRPVTHGNFWRVRRYVGGNPPVAAMNDTRVHEALDGVLSRARYPDAKPLARLDEFGEGSAEFASALLHFNNPAYPIFNEPSVRGLNHVGYIVDYRAQLDEASVDDYQAFIDAIQDLKDGIPFYHVPEKNYYLTRIVQESLWQLGTEKPVPPPSPKARSRRVTN